ncbi:MAG: VCBS repeat-containing protein [Akkermansiaceae bacterium]|nr:VCBS repeat-containing protein [Akkermansiaceae bacterium]MCP5549305.1 VCBS repeat-containing protein [Akkermansiaceae bacterium]
MTTTISTKMKALRVSCLLSLLAAAAAPGAEPPEFEWKAVEIDRIEIGYGLQLTDVDGDGKTDIVLADKSTIQWYRNPGWDKHIIAEKLTERDNVCVTARDIDGDGKCEIATGGQWNFPESIKDGAVFYLIPPEDRAQRWTPVALEHEPSTHRMHWIAGPDGKFSLAVKPLRGKGTIDGEGPGLKILEYRMPDDPSDAKGWTTGVISDFMHMSHNFHPVNWDDDPEEELIAAAKEGVWHFDRQGGEWKARQLTNEFAGEVRDGKLPGGRRFVATVEPMHGSKSAVYVEPANGGEGLWERAAILIDPIKDGHAIAVADYLGVGSDQVVVGWRAMHPKEVEGEPGIALFTPLDEAGAQWRETRVSGPEVAVEDIKAADLNGDGRADIVAAARQTKNLKIFFAAP